MAKTTENQVPNFNDFESEQIGFPPYWNPEEGKQLYAMPVARDERDPKFHRYIWKAMIDTECQNGPADDAEKVTVKSGEFFTTSVYHSLDNLPLALYMNIPVLLIAKEKVPTKTSGQEVWKWDLKLSKENKKLIDQKRETLRLQAQNS